MRWGAWYPVDREKIGQALSRHEESLENIILDRPDIFEEAADDDNCTDGLFLFPKFGVFQSFRHIS